MSFDYMRELLGGGDLTPQKLREKLRIFNYRDNEGRAIELVPYLVLTPKYKGPSVSTLVFDLVRGYAKKVSIADRDRCLDLIVDTWAQIDTNARDAQEESILTALLSLASAGWDLGGLQTRIECWHCCSQSNTELLILLNQIVIRMWRSNT